MRPDPRGPHVVMAFIVVALQGLAMGAWLGEPGEPVSLGCACGTAAEQGGQVCDDVDTDEDEDEDEP